MYVAFVCILLKDIPSIFHILFSCLSLSSICLLSKLFNKSLNLSVLQFQSQALNIVFITEEKDKQNIQWKKQKDQKKVKC